MKRDIRKVAILGAGVMGVQLAALFVANGLEVLLYDVTGPDNDPLRIVRKSVQKAVKKKPPGVPIFFSETHAKLITLCHFDPRARSEDDMARLHEVDWVIEAVKEDLAIKQSLFRRIEVARGPETMVSTNTSGIRLSTLMEGFSPAFQEWFFLTHFFNPPRFMKLVEVVPTQHTLPGIIETVTKYLEGSLAKKVILAQDTPGFIANRIGLHSSLWWLRQFESGRGSMEEIDDLTGRAMGRKMGVFRTADWVGLDICVSLASNIHQSLASQAPAECKLFEVPRFLSAMVGTGLLGSKSEGGFYRKEGKKIFCYSPSDSSYRPKSGSKPQDLEKLMKIRALPERLRRLYDHDSDLGRMFKDSILATISYSASLIPSAAFNATDVDEAMKEGFAWPMGPFELFRTIGAERVIDDLRRSGMAISPSLIRAAQEEAKKERTKTSYKKVPGFFPGLTLKDMGDEVLLVSFATKQNTLGLQLLYSLNKALDEAEKPQWKGVVLGDEDENTCVGANLLHVWILSKLRLNPVLAKAIDGLQALVLRIRRYPKPVVSGVRGLLLGGGVEVFGLACSKSVASPNALCGLVEAGAAGVVPGAGGLTRLALWSNSGSTRYPQVFERLKSAFLRVCLAEISRGAPEAKEFGYLPENTRLLFDESRILEAAKAEVLNSASSGFHPPASSTIRVLGKEARLALQQMAYVYHLRGFASDHDLLIANKVAYVLTGGDIEEPCDVTEEYLMSLEKKAFLELAATPKTMARMWSLVRKGQPLRN